MDSESKAIRGNINVRRLIAVNIIVVAVLIGFYLLAVKACSPGSRATLSETCADVLSTNGLTKDSLTCEAVCAQMEKTQKEAAAHALTSDKLFQVSLLNSCYREIKGSDCRCGSDKGAR